MESVDIDEILFNLKATITSSKGGVLLKNIESDYYNINGTSIPYQELGYSCLKKFIQSFKVFRIDESKYDPIVNVVRDAKTQHLQEMIKKQKTTKKSKYKKKSKVIHKKFTSDYSVNSKQPSYKRKVSMVSNKNNYISAVSSTNTLSSKWTNNYEISTNPRKVSFNSNTNNYTSAVSSTNTLNSKWSNNYEITTYPSKVTTVSNKNNYISAVSSTNTLNSKWLKNDKLPPYKSIVTTVSTVNNHTSTVFSTSTLDSKWLKNDEIKNIEINNKNPDVLIKVTTPPKHIQKNKSNLFEKNKKKVMNIHCDNVQNKPIHVKKMTKLCSQSAQDRLQKYVKKDISQIEIKDYNIESKVVKNLDYFSQEKSKLTHTRDKVNDTIKDYNNESQVLKNLDYFSQEKSKLTHTRDKVNDTIKDYNNESQVLKNLDYFSQEKSKLTHTRDKVNDTIKDYNNESKVVKNLDYFSQEKSKLTHTRDKVNDTIKDYNNESRVLKNLDYFCQETSKLTNTHDKVNDMIKDYNNESKVVKNLDYFSQEKSKLTHTRDKVNDTIKDYNNESRVLKNLDYFCQEKSKLTHTRDKVNDTYIINSPIKLSTNQPEPLNSEINQLQIQCKYKMTVTVTAIYSLLDIWVCLDETEKNESFWEMQKALKLKMDLNNLSPIKEDPIIGHFYALYHQQKWHRVSIECIDFDGSIVCFFIDTGKSVHANKSQIYPLESNYFIIPGQAVNILLNKFKVFNDFPLIKDILIETLVDKKFLLIPNNVITTPPSVTLYEIDTMMSVNDKILNTFFEKVTPMFPYSIEYKFIEAKVLSIHDGYLYLQPNKDLIKSLENLLLTDLFSTGLLKTNRDIDYKNVYLTTYKQNIKGRVKVVHFIDDCRVKIFFIDYGVYRIVELQKLININKVDNLVAKIPCQAVKTIMHMFPPEYVTNKTIDVFFEILGNNYYVSVIGLNNSDNVPCVQLWTGSFPDTYINMVLYTRMKKINNNFEESNSLMK